MAGLSAPRPIFGIHSVSPYSRTDGTFYGILKVLEGSSLNLSGSLVKLEGGSAKYPWAVEDGVINAEVALKTSEYPDFLFTLFLAKAPTSAGSSASGTCSTLTNKKGTSLQNATTGISTAGITPSTGAALLKFGKYVVVAASPTTVNVYFSSDADINRGTTSGVYQDDTLKVTASALTITASTPTTIPNFGIDLGGGSGTIGMTTGDTATFEVLPPNSKSTAVTVGSVVDTFPEFGMIAMAQKRGSQEMVELDIFRCKGEGMPIGMDMHAFSKADIKINAFYDSAKDGVFSWRSVSPS